MTAGSSAKTEAERQLALAAAHEAAAADARAAAGRYEVAGVTEHRIARLLAPLSVYEARFLHDRRWPGSRRAQVDLIMVGKPGVFIIDTKAWKDVSIVDQRIFRGDEDVTEDLMNLADLCDRAEEDLASIGLAPGEVHAVVVLAGRQGINARVGPVEVVGEKDLLRHIASKGERLTVTQVDEVDARCRQFFPPVSAPVQTAPPVSVEVPVLAAQADERVVDETDALFSASEVEAALLEGIMAQPVEEWMTFLHPEQAKLVRRSFNGPSRIRGAAGTGKTVVGLHRAAYLARTRPGRVLVTTYVRTLPSVLKTLLGRMAPDVVDRVDFMGVHQFASSVLDDRGVRRRLDSSAADGGFAAAWNAVPKDSPLRRKGLSERYWREEIDYVIKGRGISDFDTYAELSRTGRQHRLGLDQRRAVWVLYLDYDRNLRRQRVHDFADVILLADAELRREPLDGGYAAVIVDEAQDLSCAMVRMLHSLVGDGPDGFTLIGDGQQSIYPGGYTLAEAGLSVASRGVVLDINYRNTEEILDFAHGLVAGAGYADIEGEIARGERPKSTARSGPEPEVVRCATWREHDRMLVARVQQAVRDIGTSLGDVGVLCASSRSVAAAHKALAGVGIPTVDLKEYAGSAVDAVRVGTIKRAKGLEFKQVLVASVRLSLLEGEPPSEDDAAAREAWELARRELYVALTRARDGLWVGVVAR
ncbi:nuclease-related domain-containing DEAD/DEAH box helicase [Demequina sp. NBRC 110054]|uniref:nuclease-related domain-containing DEAD/DEAH box helicase n=1 Tax=Demequina sp. NBRC 110054 TaxID=1570343 RepID=UPI0009FBABEE|nr:UvrD-helicase domain-containing protein [Demequina sp. NBRC 110054]